MTSIAWNQLSFDMPATWEVHGMGKQHLILAAQSATVAELKWNRIRGHFRPSGYMNRLVRKMKRRTGIKMVPFDLPEKWLPLVEAYQVYGFRWQAPTIAGLGALLFCPACRMATLVQFYEDRQNEIFDGDAMDLLASFRDHRKDGRTIWSIYDIRADLPQQMVLTHFRFNPGAFELTFGYERLQVTLYRWSPASILLRGLGLDGFARQRFPLEESRYGSIAHADPNYYEWRKKPAVAPGEAFVERFQFRAPLNQLRLWHLEPANRILGIAVVGRRSMDPERLDGISNNFEVMVS